MTTHDNKNGNLTSDNNAEIVVIQEFIKSFQEINFTEALKNMIVMKNLILENPREFLTDEKHSNPFYSSSLQFKNLLDFSEDYLSEIGNAVNIDRITELRRIIVFNLVYIFGYHHFDDYESINILNTLYNFM